MVQLFVSDLHLEDSRPDISRAFFHLLERFKGKIAELYLLGDIFEVWLGDDTPSVCATDLAQRLSAMAFADCNIYLMHGNRDFLVGPKYARACSATLIDEPYPLRVAGKSALLMHGDILCTRDLEYLAFRNMVRDPTWQQAFLAKPLSDRITIARQLREQSRQSNQQKAESIMDVTQDEVIKVMEQHQVDLLIHGHTHRPALHNVKLQQSTAERIVLGDWYQQGWYILADGTSAKLEPFPFPG